MGPALLPAGIGKRMCIDNFVSLVATVGVVTALFFGSLYANDV